MQLAPQKVDGPDIDLPRQFCMSFLKNSKQQLWGLFVMSGMFVLNRLASYFPVVMLDSIPVAPCYDGYRYMTLLSVRTEIQFMNI